MKRLSSLSYLLFFVLILSATFISFTSCSANETVKDSEIASAEKIFIFKYGDDIYRAEFNDKKISRLFKNEKEIPKEQLNDYKDIVNYELKMLTDDLSFRQEKPGRIKIFIDQDSFNEDTLQFDEEYEPDFPMLFKFKLDDDFLSDLRLQIDSLVKELKNKDFEIYINPEKLREPMLKYRKYFRDFNLPEPPEFDKEKFRKDKEEFFKEKKNLDSLNKNLREMFRNIKPHQKKNIEIIELKKNTLRNKNQNCLVRELKEQLIKDGVINSTDEGFYFKIQDDKITVNNKSLPEHLIDKYKKLISKYEDTTSEYEVIVETE